MNQKLVRDHNRLVDCVPGSFAAPKNAESSLRGEQVCAKTMTEHRVVHEEEKSMQFGREMIDVQEHVQPDGSSVRVESVQGISEKNSDIVRQIDTVTQGIEHYRKRLFVAEGKELIDMSPQLNKQMSGDINPDGSPGMFGYGIFAEIRTFMSHYSVCDSKPWSADLSAEARAEQIELMIQESEGGAVVLWSWKELLTTPSVAKYIDEQMGRGDNSYVWDNIIRAKTAFNAFFRGRDELVASEWSPADMIELDDKWMQLSIGNMEDQRVGHRNDRSAEPFVWSVEVNVSGKVREGPSPIPKSFYLVDTDPAMLRLLQLDYLSRDSVHQQFTLVYNHHIEFLASMGEKLQPEVDHDWYYVERNGDEQQQQQPFTLLPSPGIGFSIGRKQIH
jgi:hypothetical protein